MQIDIRWSGGNADGITNASIGALAPDVIVAPGSFQLQVRCFTPPHRTNRVHGSSSRRCSASSTACRHLAPMPRVSRLSGPGGAHSGGEREMMMMRWACRPAAHWRPPVTEHPQHVIVALAGGSLKRRTGALSRPTALRVRAEPTRDEEKGRGGFALNMTSLSLRWHRDDVQR